MMMLGGGGEGGSMLPVTDLSGDIAGKLNVLLTESDDESEFSQEGLVREEKLEEIMQELYREITSSSYNTSPPTLTLTSPSSSSSSPFPLSSLPFLASSDVKSESCGASMSDSASTVMAGIEFVGPAGNFDERKVGFPVTAKGSPENELWVMGMDFDDNNNSSNNDAVGGSVGGSGEDQKMEGCDEGEVGDDQWLARVLGWGPLELEECRPVHGSGTAGYGSEPPVPVPWIGGTLTGTFIDGSGYGYGTAGYGSVTVTVSNGSGYGTVTVSAPVRKLKSSNLFRY